MTEGSVVAQTPTRADATEPPQTIVFHATLSQHGGVETYIYYLSLYLAARGLRVTLASQRRIDLNDAWMRDLRAAGVRIIAPPRFVRRLPGPSALIVARLLLSWRLRTRSFDRVVGMGHGGAYRWMKRFVRPGGYFLWTENWYGVPTRGDDYGASFAPPPLEPLPPRMRRLVADVDGILAGCDRAAANLRTIQRVACPIAVVAPLTVFDRLPQARDRSYSPDTVVRVGMIARHGVGKGTVELLNLWPSLDIGPAELHLYGPVESDQVRDLATRLQDDQSITVHGPFDRQDLPTILDRLDLGLMLSIEEGYGLVPREYMACGLPFVMTDVGASAELTGGNPDACCVPVSTEGMRRGIEEMVTRLRANRLSRERLQARYRATLTPDIVAERHLALLSTPPGRWGML